MSGGRNEVAASNDAFSHWSGLDDGKVNFSSMSLTATVASPPIESPVKGALFLFMLPFPSCQCWPGSRSAVHRNCLWHSPSTSLGLLWHSRRFPYQANTLLIRIALSLSQVFPSPTPHGSPSRWAIDPCFCSSICICFFFFFDQHPGVSPRVLSVLTCDSPFPFIGPDGWRLT